MPLSAKIIIGGVIASLVLLPGLTFLISPRGVQRWEIRMLENHKWWVAGSERRERRLRSDRHPRHLRVVGVFLVVLSSLILAGIGAT